MTLGANFNDRNFENLNYILYVDNICQSMISIECYSLVVPFFGEVVNFSGVQYNSKL